MPLTNTGTFAVSANATSALGLVRQELDQAQDRFVGGVASNLEVVEAQESLALADESVIASPKDGRPKRRIMMSPPTRRSS
jgi:hypothetical protein